MGGSRLVGAERARSDDVLVARLQAGDDRALAAAYDEHGGMVYGLARRVTVDEQLARDITQDVFVFLWQHPERVDLERGTLRAYLGVLAHRRAVDAVRRATRRDRAESAAVDLRDHDDEGFDDEIASESARAWCHDQLFVALDQLPDDQRAAVVLAYFEGNSYREVARLLDIPEGTAKSRIRLGLARVRAVIGDDLRVER